MVRINERSALRTVLFLSFESPNLVPCGLVNKDCTTVFRQNDAVMLDFKSSKVIESQPQTVSLVYSQPAYLSFHSQFILWVQCKKERVEIFNAGSRSVDQTPP